MTSQYAECEKMRAASAESQIIGQFLEWATDNGYHFARDTSPEVSLGDWGINKALAAYFEIDLDKVETEKRQMLDDIRNQDTGVMQE